MSHSLSLSLSIYIYIYICVCVCVCVCVLLLSMRSSLCYSSFFPLHRSIHSTLHSWFPAASDINRTIGGIHLANRNSLLSYGHIKDMWKKLNKPTTANSLPQFTRIIPNINSQYPFADWPRRVNLLKKRCMNETKDRCHCLLFINLYFYQQEREEKAVFSVFGINYNCTYHAHFFFLFLFNDLTIESILVTAKVYEIFDSRKFIFL